MIDPRAISADARCQRQWYALRPHVKQDLFYRSAARFNVVPAGRRSGKTAIAKRRGILKALSAQQYDGARYVFAAPTHQQAKRIFWKDLKLMVPPERLAGTHRQAISDSELTIQLWNGAEILVSGLDKPERLEGSPIDHIVVDEYGNVKKEAWDEHVRPALSERGGTADLIGAPEGRNHYYNMAIQAEQQQVTRPDLWGFFTWFSADILPADEIEAARNELDERTFRQEYEGSFETFEGRVYYCFTREDNVRPCEYDPELPLIIALDFNVKPGVAAILQDLEVPIHGRDPLWYTRVIDEVWIADNSSTIRVCEEIGRKWGRKHGGEVRVYGDASGGARKTSQVAGSDWDLVRRVLGPIFRDRLSVRVGWSNPPERVRVNAVNSRLKSANGSVWLTVDPKCVHMIQDFEGVVYKEGTGEIDKKATPMLSHISDGVGYLINEVHPLVSAGSVVEQW